MDEYMGIIKIFAGNFAPNGWFFCSGQLLPINQYTALFSLLGTTYGGDGVTTFGLPDLRGRVPVGAGMGTSPNGGANVNVGQLSGSTAVTLTAPQMPAHQHGLLVNSGNASDATPTANSSAISSPGTGSGRSFNATLGYATATPNTPLTLPSIGVTGQSQPHDNMQPNLGISYIICWQGLYPSRP